MMVSLPFCLDVYKSYLVQGSLSEHLFRNGHKSIILLKLRHGGWARQRELHKRESGGVVVMNF